MAEHRTKALTACDSGAKVPKAPPDANRRKAPTVESHSTGRLSECLPLGSAGESPETALPVALDPSQGPYRHHPGCTLFESCFAPFCPLDPASLKGIWYPDEEICRSRSQGGHPWIRSQRRIAKVAGHGAGYFTLEMLNRLIVIRKGITGLDPDLPEEAQLRTWFQKRPERGESSERSPATRADHLRKFGFRKKGGKKGARGGLKKGRAGTS
jgi:hypothetical protein